MQTMNTPVEWHDSYFKAKDRTVLTENETQVPGVQVLAHHQMTKAISPLVEHYHKDCFEFTFMDEGVFNFHINTHDYRMVGGDIFIAFPNESHSTNFYPLSCGEIYWFQLNISSPENFLFLEKKAAASLIHRLLNLDMHVYEDNSGKLRSFLKMAFQLAVNFENPYLTASYLTLFLNELTHTHPKQRTLSREIYNSLEYIEDHIYTDISLEYLAHSIGLSESHFKLRFKQEIGMSPSRYISNKKMNIAKDLLLEGSSKTEVARQLVFN